MPVWNEKGIGQAEVVQVHTRLIEARDGHAQGQARRRLPMAGILPATADSGAKHGPFASER